MIERQIVLSIGDRHRKIADVVHNVATLCHGISGSRRAAQQQDQCQTQSGNRNAFTRFHTQHLKSFNFSKPFCSKGRFCPGNVSYSYAGRPADLTAAQKLDVPAKDGTGWLGIDLVQSVEGTSSGFTQKNKREVGGLYFSLKYEKIDRSFYYGNMK